MTQFIILLLSPFLFLAGIDVRLFSQNSILSNRLYQNSTASSADLTISVSAKPETDNSTSNEQILDWFQWRGPNRDGIISNNSPWPKNLSESNLIQKWRFENLGPSYSGPIITKDYVFTTETSNKKLEIIHCLDRLTGKELWKYQWEGSITVPFFAARNGSWIRSTPVVDKDAIYVAGIRDRLICLEIKDGKVRWDIDFPSKVGSKPPDFGFVCSPILDDKGVYAQVGSALVKIDKKTGKIIWTTLKEDQAMMSSAFSSPILVKYGKQVVLVVQTRTKLVIVDPDSGKVLVEKEIPTFRGMNILTPSIFKNSTGLSIFTSTYGGNTRLMQLTDNDKLSDLKDCWSFKYEGYMTSPVFIDHYAYLFGKDRRMICIDLLNGNEKWRSDSRFGEYWSLIGHNKQILALDQMGILYLIDANPNQFSILEKRKLSTSETWAHLAIYGKTLFIRDLDGINCFEWKE